MFKSDKVLLSVNDWGGSYASMYTKYFSDNTEDMSILFESPERVGMVSFTGGEDVSPSLYNEPTGFKTNTNKRRDDMEKAIFDKALMHNIPMVGICRGSQFLNVMCGGRMIQDVTNHAGTIHTVKTYKGETMLVNSTHHQMSVPSDEAVILAWASPKISNHYLNGNDEDEGAPEFEVESFIYPRYNVVGWQYHPEMIKAFPKDELMACVEFVDTVLHEFIFNKKESKVCQVNT